MLYILNNYPTLLYMYIHLCVYIFNILVYLHISYIIYMGIYIHTILGGSKITEDGDCCHEIKRRLLLGRKVMTNLDSIFKSRDITLPTKVHLVKAMVFRGHVWM